MFHIKRNYFIRSQETDTRTKKKLKNTKNRHLEKLNKGN